jgi:mycoredoxin
VTGATITVFWRPGCMFGSALLRDLERLDVPHERRDIWQDPKAAAAVRAAASGNETVPTVRIGEVTFVNPSAAAGARRHPSTRPPANCPAPLNRAGPPAG